LRKRRAILLLAAVVVVAAAVFWLMWPLFPPEWFGIEPGPKPRPAEWAAPLDRPGLSNLHRVSEDLYRGAQPTAEGMRQLKAMGIKTVVNLRELHSDRDEIGDTGLAYEDIRMTPWDPDDDEVVRFLQIVTDKARTPVFVHCQRGSDRTGLMCAIYRMVVEHWGREEAVAEMTQGGFGYAGLWKPLVDYLREADLDQLRRRAGLTP